MNRDIKTLSSETITVSPEFFKDRGDRVVFPIPQELIDASDEEELAEIWTHIFDKNYERFLPEDIVSVVKKLGYFAFAHIFKNQKDDVLVKVYICNISSIPFTRTSSVCATSGCCWHDMNTCIPFIPGGSFVTTVTYSGDGAGYILIPDGRIETKHEKYFEYASDDELFEVTEGHVLFYLLELRLRRMLDRA